MRKPISQEAEEDCGQDQQERCKKGWEPILCKKLAAGHASFNHMKRFSEKSRLDRFDDEVHSVPWSAIRKKNVLGQGAYSMVYKVQVSMNVNDASKATTLDNQKYYALKHIKPDITDESKDFDVAAVDLAIEGEMLSRLRHDNIIKLHGVYSGDPKTSYVDFKHGYFLLIDVLGDTLTRRLAKMRKLVKKRRRGTAPSVLDLIQNVAIGIAKGLEYLHENNVILRDLKPDNVGFDEKNAPIIFDLGFARELHTVHKSEVAGSIRYMAPEIGLRQGAKLASDVYSFGVLLYELCTLEKPYKQYRGRTEFIQDVFVHNYRPDLTSISSKTMRDLISSCWDGDHTKRPTMKRVVNILRVETALLQRERLSTKSAKVSTQRRSDNSVSSTQSSLSFNAFGSVNSFRSSTKNLVKPSTGSTTVPSCLLTSSSTDIKNSFARRSSIIRRMGSKNFDWNNNPSATQENSTVNDKNMVFGIAQRRRNSFTSSLLDRRKRSTNSIASSTSANDVKESRSAERIAADYTRELSAPNTRLSNRYPTRRSYGRGLARGISCESETSLASTSGDSCATSYSTDLSTSNFTLGEFRARVLGRSRRNRTFSSGSSRSSKDLFRIDVCHGSNTDDENISGDSDFGDDCIEDMSLLTKKEVNDQGKQEERASLPKLVHP